MYIRSIYSSFASTAPERIDYQYSATASIARYPPFRRNLHTYIQIYIVYIFVLIKDVSMPPSLPPLRDASTTTSQPQHP